MSKRCLVIDDVEVSRYVLGNHMEELGFKVVETADIEEAQELLKKDRFDVILLDWHLRQKNNLADVIPLLKKSIGGSNSSILVCSGVEQGDMSDKVRDLGADGFIAKPSTLEVIKAQLKKLAVL